MSTKARKILFTLFIFAFLIITPLVSLYATGYKISLDGRFLQKTGMLVINSNPSGANIFIDGEPQQRFLDELGTKITNKTNKENILKTPAKIKGLVPGEYDISLEKEGYWGWQKKLEITPGNSTFAEDVFLFKNNLPISIFSENVLSSSQSPNKKNSVFITEDNYIVFYHDNDRIEYYSRSDEDIDNSNSIIWIDNIGVLINSKLFYISNWDSPKDLSGTIGDIPPEDIRSYNSNSAFFKKNNNLIKFNFRNEGLETVLNSENLIDFSFKNNFLYTIEEIEESVYFIIYENYQKVRQINLSYDTEYTFLETEQNLVNIYNKKFKTLYLVDPFDYFSPLKETINNVNHVFWVNDNKLVYYNDFEIWTYDNNIHKKTIITRISNKINNVLWHPSNNYLLFSTNDSLFTIELDDRDRYNSVRLLNMSNIEFLNMNTRGDFLYFFADLRDRKSYFKLAI